MLSLFGPVFFRQETTPLSIVVAAALLLFAMIMVMVNVPAAANRCGQFTQHRFRRRAVAQGGDVAINGCSACTANYRMRTTLSHFPPDFQMEKPGEKAGTSFGASLLPA